MVQDQMGYEVRLDDLPNRIVSLVPSQTELLCDLGLGEKLLGVTKFCVHPSDVISKKIIVGGTKKFRFDVIDTIKPDLILGNKEENYKLGIERLKEKYKVWMSDIATLEDATNMISQVGNLTNTGDEASDIINSINTQFHSLDTMVDKKTVIYLIWQDPIMSVGADTFIHDMINKAGFKNLTNSLPRYPVLDYDEIKSLKPEYIFLSSEPFPFREKHQKEFQERFPGSKVVLVDGEMFSWYGSRLRLAPAYFKSLHLL